MTFSMIRLAAIAAACLPAMAQAQAGAPAEPMAATQPSPFGAARPIEDAALNTVTGRDDVAQVVNADNRATVSGNSVSGTSQTGTIRFDGNAFTGLNGLSLLSANTGNNVSINASMNVNVAISGR